MRARRLIAAVLALCLILPAGSMAAAARASLTDIEPDVMCVTCREPLSVAQSPQAAEERDYIRHLISQGLDKQQIERALVGQYGQAVLGKPPASGFNLTVYVLPAAVLAVGLITLAIVLPCWRRSARARRAAPVFRAAALSAGDAQRLEEDLSRFDA